MVTELYSSLLLGRQALWTTLHQLLRSLPSPDQRAVFDTLLRDLTRKYLHSETWGIESTSTIGAVAAMVNGLVQHNHILESYVIEWLTSTNGQSAGLGLDARRAVIATLAKHQGKSS
jgi:hypothetical protein